MGNVWNKGVKQSSAIKGDVQVGFRAYVKSKNSKSSLLEKFSKIGQNFFIFFKNSRLESTSKFNINFAMKF